MENGMETADRLALSENEIEITPEMIEAAEELFFGWWAKNGHFLSVGLPGDLVDLRLRLNAAFANLSISSSFASKLR